MTVYYKIGGWEPVNDRAGIVCVYACNTAPRGLKRININGTTKDTEFLTLEEAERYVRDGDWLRFDL